MRKGRKGSGELRAALEGMAALPVTRMTTPKPEAELSDLRVMVQELLPLLYGNIQISKTHLDELRELAYAPHAPSELVKASELAHREICRLDYSHNRVAMSLRAELDKVKS